MGAKESKNDKNKFQVTIGRETDQGDTPEELAERLGEVDE